MTDRPTVGGSQWLRRGRDGLDRCWWCGEDPDYVRYHDEEWGRPLPDDRGVFEKLSLEGFQSGLSWLTILRKRDNFRRAFAGFEIATVAAFGADDVERLLLDAGIVRHRGKIVSTVNNAGRAQELIESGTSLGDLVRSYRPDAPRRVDGGPGLPSATPESVALSKDLKRRGWTFVGPTTVYSLMQSMGVVNDHVEGCWAREHCAGV